MDQHEPADAAATATPVAHSPVALSPIALSWSGGKDSAMALHHLLAQGRPVRRLLTTLTSGVDRISMHGVRRTLLQQQAAAVGVPLAEVWLSQRSSNEEYDREMAAAVEALRSEGIDAIAFGDLFLADVRAYREERLEPTGMTPEFPLWGRDTTAFAEEFVRLGFRAVLVCVDTEQLDADFAGREYDEALLADLPAGVDPCAENGEFHTFVHDGPVFAEPVPFRHGETVLRDGRFAFHDLSPV